MLVLSTAYVLKEQVLEAIERRHADERAFQTILSEWQAATSNPEKHPQWSRFYANALRDALNKANYRRQEALTALTIADWRMLIFRELQTERWYVEPEVDSILPSEGEATMPPVPLDPQARHNGNGAHPE